MKCFVTENKSLNYYHCSLLKVQICSINVKKISLNIKEYKNFISKIKKGSKLSW